MGNGQRGRLQSIAHFHAIYHLKVEGIDAVDALVIVALRVGNQ
jgi:hypothetical protein